jgi:hypothetical protein
LTGGAIVWLAFSTIASVVVCSFSSVCSICFSFGNSAADQKANLFRTPTREDKALVQGNGSALTTTAGLESDDRGRSFNDITKTDVFISDEPRKPDAPRFAVGSRFRFGLFRFHNSVRTPLACFIE